MRDLIGLIVENADLTNRVQVETRELATAITPINDGAALFREFIKLASTKGSTLRTIIYGCTLPIFYDGVVNAKKAGCDVKIIFDHTQSHGHYERKHIEALVADGFKDGVDFVTGTSMSHHQIVHLKRTSIILPNNRFITEFGSWNYSTSASYELNDVTVIESEHLVNYTNSSFDQLWKWIVENEPQYQTFTAHHV